jgi:hypothetical protein
VPRPPPSIAADPNPSTSNRAAPIPADANACGGAGWSCGSGGGPANGGYADVVAAGEFIERSALLRAAVWPLSAAPGGLGAAPAFGGAGAD